MIRSILLVDDDLLDQTMFRLTFKNFVPSVSITCAGNGLLGLEALKQNIPDLIFLDQNMPEMDGLEFLKIIKSTPSYKHIPVVVFTPSLYLAAHNKELIARGAFRYALKDISFNGSGSVLGIVKELNKQSAA